MNQTAPVSAFKASWQAGLIFGGVLIIVNLASFIFQFSGNWVAGIATLAIWVVALVYFQKDYRDKKLGGYISYGKCLGFGTLMFINAAILANLFSYIYLTLIDPGYLDVIRAEQYEALQPQLENMGEEQIAMTKKWVDNMSSGPMIAIFGFIGMVFWGFIISLITSAFIKRNAN